MQQPSFYLFVYGSLRKGFQHPAYEYISRYFHLVSEAKVKGSLYDMGLYPAAIPTANDLFISGELYRINHAEEFDWAIAQLDDYEGIYPEPGETPLYRRELADIFLPDRTESAWVYWFNGEVHEHRRINSGDLLVYLQEKQKNQNG
jgi:gamma-glutamylcyclotransferase (GGCT)/AIG2-like uncharacterized protein YtfP